MSSSSDSRENGLQCAVLVILTFESDCVGVLCCRCGCVVGQ